MLLGNIFTGLAFAAMAIAPVACIPTAEPDLTTLEVKRTTVGDHARTCYTQVQTHCSNINNHIHTHGGHIDVSLVDYIVAELGIIVSLVLDLSLSITVSISIDDVQDCGPTFVSLVKILTDLLNSLTGACDAGAIAALVDLVLSLLAHITLISGCLLTNIGGLLGSLLALLAGVLRSLQLDITASVSLFTSACGAYHH